jgi:hypothetical protein
MRRPTKRVVALYDKRWTSTQWIKKDKDAFKLEYLSASFPTTNAAGAIAGGTGGATPPHGSADLAIQTVRGGVKTFFVVAVLATTILQRGQCRSSIGSRPNGPSAAISAFDRGRHLACRAVEAGGGRPRTRPGAAP